jgi:hypothetical protein
VAGRRAKLEPITLHDARHTAGVVVIAAGLNVKALSTYLGTPTPASPSTAPTISCQGSETEAAERLDAYLAQATSEALGSRP